MRGRLPWVVGAVFLFAFAWYVFFPLASGQPFAYDDSDYMWAGRQGLWANYTDRNGLSFIEFIRKGLELYRNPEKRSSFSQFIRESGDIGMYRHYHGPMYAYWLAFLHNLGVTREQVFRGSGLLIHFATATVILFGFWAAFRRLPLIAGFVACALFVFNRTALTAAMVVTQHVAFTFWLVATLFAASMFFRNYETRWLYATMALLAGCFATVETSALMVIALTLALIIDHRRAREKWPTVNRFAVAMLKAAGVFVLSLLVLWPKSVLQLGLLKGFLQQGYIAVARKTFSPGTPLDLWRALFAASPWEFPLLLTGLIAAAALWRRSAHRAEMLPWLAFVFTFLLVTLKVTVGYTYYYAPLTASAIVLTGTAFGIAWERWGTAARVVLPVCIVASIVGTATEWARVAKEVRDTETFQRAVLDFVNGSAIDPDRDLYVPYQAVPTLHYYRPDLKTVGYDYGYPLDSIVAGLRSAASADTMICEKPFCDAVESFAADVVENRTPLHPRGPTGKSLYVLRLRKGS